MSVLALTLLTSAAIGLAPTGIVSDCRTVVVPRQAGQIVQESDTKIVPCNAVAAPPRLRFDARRGAAVAIEALAEGDELGRVYFPPEPGVRVGDRVQIHARIGHVTVMRKATALQGARVGQPFFARSDDGVVFVVPRLAPGTKR